MHVFSFDSTHATSGSSYAYTIIFLGLEPPDCAVIDDEYLRWSNANVPLPNILIIGATDAMQRFSDTTRKVQGRILGLERLSRHSRVILCGFDQTGTLFEIGGSTSNIENLTQVFYEAVRAHIDQQIEHSDVVIPAPPSIYFGKLSNRFSSHFIRAEALLESTSVIEMLALRLLGPFHDWISKSSRHDSDTINIYLDTMSIWPIAEKLRQLHEHGEPKYEYRIESFKSYDGFDQWNPQGRPGFIIVSATTSGGLATKIRKKMGTANAEIWTLITLEPEEITTKSGPAKHDGQLDLIIDACEQKVEDYDFKYVYQLPRNLKGKPALGELRSKFENNIKVDKTSAGVETISIVGERFLSQPVKPKRVRLIHTSVLGPTKTCLNSLAQAQVVKAARGRYDSQTRWSISFDFNKLINLACAITAGDSTSIMKRWLSDFPTDAPIALVFPSAEGTSAAAVTNAAIELAERTKYALKESAPDSKVFCISSDDLANSSREFKYPLSECNFIIVTPVIGNGFIFKQISALIRRVQPGGTRLYLALAALPESQNHLDNLKRDITMGGGDNWRFNYQFSAPVGRLDSVVQWSDELDVLVALQELMEEQGLSTDIVTSRLGLLEQLEILDDRGIFLPSFDKSPLLVAEGFTLWPDLPLKGDNYGAAVLLSIAALLQAVRTAKGNSDETSLRTSLFQHSLICPESFTRFNDAAIQGALLRAAYPSELNYSVSPDMSHDMKRLLMKWLQYHEHPAGAAAAEFLLAMAIGKLKLCEGDQRAVLEYAATLPNWLGCLGKIALKRVCVVDDRQRLTA